METQRDSYKNASGHLAPWTAELDGESGYYPRWAGVQQMRTPNQR